MDLGLVLSFCEPAFRELAFVNWPFVNEHL